MHRESTSQSRHSPIEPSFEAARQVLPGLETVLQLGYVASRSHTDFERCRWDQVGKARGVNRPSPSPSPQPPSRPEANYHPPPGIEYQLQNLYEQPAYQPNPQQPNPYQQPAYQSNPQQQPMYGLPPQWQPDVQAPPDGQYAPQGVYPSGGPAYEYAQGPLYGYGTNAPPQQAYTYGDPPPPFGQHQSGAPF